MDTPSPVRPFPASRPWFHLRPASHRSLFVTVAILGLLTIAAGSQLSRLLAPNWSEVHHAIVNAGGQLLALVGLFTAALHVEKLRGSGGDLAEPPETPSEDHSP